MNISKKALMSVLMALTSLVAIAQPYYHVMKRDDGNQTEKAKYNSKKYKIRVDMVKKPKDAIGGKITVKSDCKISPQRSFYFTNKGNVYYNNSTGKFYFEESQLDYPSGTYDINHCGHFRWGRTIDECIDTETSGLNFYAKDTDFYFANPEYLPKLQEDLGDEKWAVLSYCEWEYIIKNYGVMNWTVDGNPCYLIDTTPDMSLIKTIFKKTGGRRAMSKEQFTFYEAKGLVCLPFSGIRQGTSITNRIIGPGQYWSCTPSSRDQAWKLVFSSTDWSTWGVNTYFSSRNTASAVRLVILADD
jgi:hypothetical protein